MKYILKKNAKILILVGISIIIVNILSASHPLVMKGILDIDITAKDALIKLFLTYFIIHIILVLAKNTRNSIINKAMSKILKDLREKLFYHILKWDMSTYQKYNSSEIYTRLTADIDNVSSLFLGTIQAIAIYLILIYVFHINITISLGSIYLVINYIQNCRTPLNEIFTELEEIQSSSMSLKRINKLLKEQGKEDIELGEVIENVKGDIEFENVCMQYGENKVLHNISFIIKEVIK